MAGNVAAGAAAHLRRTVIDNGFCVGCGVCAAARGSRFAVGFDAYGRLQAQPRPAAEPAAGAEPDYAAICPFGEAAHREDTLARDRFGGDLPGHTAIGFYRAVYAGHVAEAGFREAGSSGGMGTWILHELFRRGMIDGVINVHAVDPREEGRLFRFGLSTTAAEIRQSAKSRYYPVELSQVLQTVRERPGRYALVGVPCFVKAAHLLCRRDPELADRIRYTVGLVCGHLKSSRFVGLFAWQNGMHPDAVTAVDFRHKLSGEAANQYGVRIVGTIDGKAAEVVRQNKSHFGYLWGHGFFKYRACDYCDDVVGETADISVGDAWLPAYVGDSNGTNIVVVRHPELAQIVEEARGEGRLHLDTLDPDSAARSQDAGLRHRRIGLAIRLADRVRKGQWVPPKRVPADARGTDLRTRMIYRLRERLTDASHRTFDLALKRNSFALFRRRMNRQIVVFDLFHRRRGVKGLAKFIVALVRAYLPNTQAGR